MKINSIYLGNAKKVLQSLPAESIDMCVTSPPYWALRDYKVKGEIWDEDKNCKHDFYLRHTKQRPNFKGDISKKTMYGQGYRDYVNGFCKKCGAWKGQLGLEPNFDLYVKHLCDIFDDVKTVLKKDGTCWVNLGDTYCGSGVSSPHHNNLGLEKKTIESGVIPQSQVKPKWKNIDIPKKSLIMLPFRFAIEMVNRGWILRNVIIWHKPNAMPASVKDRFTVDFEYLFFFSKSGKYYFTQQRESHKNKSLERIKRSWNGHREPMSSYENINIERMCHPRGRNMRCVWTLPTSNCREAHFAVYPPKLIEKPILSGCPEKGIVLDPFMGSGTTALVALKQNKRYIGIELNEEYIKIAKKRIDNFLTNN